MFVVNRMLSVENWDEVLTSVVFRTISVTTA